MRTFLKFKISEIVKIVEDVKKSNKHFPSMYEMYDENLDCIKQGIKKRTKMTIPYKSDEIDYSKAKMALHLIKDDGIYILGNACNDKNNYYKTELISYADTYNSKIDKDVWERSREAVGGSDFVFSFPVEWYEDVITQKPESEFFVLEIGDEYVSYII